MNLKLVTFDIDLTQFLVDARTNDEAIQRAIELNNSEFLGKMDDDHWICTNDKHNYTVDDVSMELLCGLMLRNDCLGISDNVIVFAD